MSKNYQGIRINPMDSVDLTEIENNIEANLELITTWVDTPEVPVPESAKKAVILGAGPSLKESLGCGYIHKDMFRQAAPSSPADAGSHYNDYEIYTCKHALPLLKKYGFKDYYCVALDPREIDGISTHDVKRSELYDAVTPEDNVTFLIASMTHPSVTKHLTAAGHKIIGWHATTKALERKFKERVPVSIGGGTNSILRSIALAKIAHGVSEFLILGVDNTLEPPDRYVLDNQDSYWYTDMDPVANKPKRLLTFFDDGKNPGANQYFPMWTTGELMAGLQDLQSYAENAKALGVTLHIIGTDKGRSLAGQLAEAYGL